MTISLDNFNKLQARVAALQKEAERAKGAQAQLLADLKERFGVKTVEEAKELLKKLEKQEQRVGQEYGELKEQFDATYGHLLAEE